MRGSPIQTETMNLVFIFITKKENPSQRSR